MGRAALTSVGCAGGPRVPCAERWGGGWGGSALGGVGWICRQPSAALPTHLASEEAAVATKLQHKV